eukprot:TRINITY_DN79955_c0_g1_i1.p1 TRINITY_DN79955_c0_g1~~TRINITY_DN79955_c0_g1_i1.p1  ORF type:complete len:385 (+),score=62.24 TRINITY_DN79955_c0_g1_i1:141-1157(+)
MSDFAFAVSAQLPSSCAHNGYRESRCSSQSQGSAVLPKITSGLSGKASSSIDGLRNAQALCSSIAASLFIVSLGRGLRQRRGKNSCRSADVRRCCISSDKASSFHMTAGSNRATINRRYAASSLGFGSVLLAEALLVSPAEAIGDGQSQMRQGMQAFSRGKVDESIKLFDQAANNDYPKAMLWQRGLSLYYADRFEDGATQFRKDVEMNPNDTEESIWAMLCEARLVGFEQARKKMLVVKRDRRPVMRTAYSLFRGENADAAQAELEKYASGSNDSDKFYAALYLGLYAEAKGDAQTARQWIERSVASDYGKSSGDYMADLARVHMSVRGWSDSKKEL